MGKSQRKEERRKCPVCLKVKTFPVRNEVCSRECKDRRQRAELAQPSLAREKSLRDEIRALRKQIEASLSEQGRNEQYADFIGRVTSRPVEIPAWVRKPRSGSGKSVIAKALFSDWHFGEVVNPAEVRYLNGYNPAIQSKRVKNFFNNVLELSFDYLKGFTYDGLVLSCLGDILSGDIHEELRTTNATSMMAQCLRMVPQVAAGIRQLASEFGKVWVIWVVGNHGRNTKKPIAKGRVENNIDWLFGEMVRDALADDPRISWAISPSHSYLYSIYRWRFLASHMDNARGGSGIASLLSPLMIADARQRKTVEYDFWEGGHWHQRAMFKRVLVNGAGKGFDEYALISNFDFTWPEQSFYLVDPRYGLTCSWPIHVIDQSEEWIQNCPMPVPGRFEPTPPVAMNDVPLPGRAA